MPISLLLSQLTDCSLINPRIHEVLEIRIIEVCLHKLCFLLQHGSYDSNHIIIEGDLRHLPIPILNGINEIHTAGNTLRQFINLPLVSIQPL